MNETALEQFKQKLFRLRLELQKLEESSKEAGKLMAPDQTDADRLSRRDAMQALLIAEEPARRRQRQLGKIEGAFRRIEAGDYGCCFLCGKEIESERLSEDPTCTR